MAKITLKKYAEKHGRALRTIQQKAKNGGFKTAEKIGRDWLIDENEPYIDNRIKSGEYKNWRNTDKPAE